MNAADALAPGDATALPTTVSGVVQKGPFVRGSSVTVQELDANLAPTGKTFNVTTTDDEGDFAVPVNVSSRYVEIIASGFYFDELTNQLTSAPLSLRAQADLTSSATVHVNLLTSMSEPLTRTLVSQGMSFAQALSQAESSVLAALRLPPLGTSFSNVSLTGSATASAELLAASLIVQQYAASLGSSEVAQLTQLLSEIGAATADAGGGNSTLDALTASLCATIWAIPVSSVRANLTRYYSSLGASAVIPPYEQFLCGCGIMCGTTCINQMTDTMNCGACGAACATGASCKAGTCACPCGQTVCAGACVTGVCDAGVSGADAGPSCTSNLVMCSGTSTDVCSDPANCGACGHGCLGGGCQGGACQPLVVASNEVVPGGITVDPLGGAYWANFGTTQNGYSDGSIRHIALASTTPVTIASNVQAPLSAISDGTTVFFLTEGTLLDASAATWNGDGQLLACAATGCRGAPSVIASNQYGGAMRLGPSRVYWNNGNASLFMSALTTGGGLTSTSGAVAAFAVTSSMVFISPNQGLFEMALDGGAETPLQPITPMISAIEADLSAVYWVDNLTIQSCQLPSCTSVTTLYQAPQSVSIIEPFTSDATSLYWFEAGYPPTVTGVYSCAKSQACCTPRLLVATPGVSSLAVAPAAIYWTGWTATQRPTNTYLVVRLAR